MIKYNTDVKILLSELVGLPTKWDGKASILELKEANYNWRQMEWWGFYFEYKVRNLLAGSAFQIPGDKHGNVGFDLKGKINWDIRLSTIEDAEDLFVTLNDVEAIDCSIKEHKYHGEIIMLCNARYDDRSRSFQKWFSELKGENTEYLQHRHNLYRMKTQVELHSVILLLIEQDNVDFLGKYYRKRSANVSEIRPTYTYTSDIEIIDKFKHYEINFDIPKQ